MNAPVAAALGRLTDACRRLGETEGRPIARRNARKAVLAQLRQLRAKLDEAFPAVPTRKRKLPRKRKLAMEKRGWRRAGAETAARYAAYGVRVKRTKEEHPLFGTETAYWIPQWASTIGLNFPSQLHAAVRNIKARKALLATIALSPAGAP